MPSAAPNISNANPIEQQHCCFVNSSSANNLIRMAKRRELNEEEKAWAKACEALWAKKKAAENLTQDDPAAALGLSGQSAFSQFITGKVPMNYEMRSKMARYFGVPVTEIDKDFYSRLEISPTHLDPAERAFIDLLRQIDKSDVYELLDFIEVKMRRRGRDPTELIKIIRGAMEKTDIKAKKKATS